MHIQCTICSDLMNQADSLYGTKCGHIFHYHCLAQWIERSKSCPQCRNKVTERCMFRLYPTAPERPREDAAELQARLDGLALQLHTQQAEARKLEEKLAAATADVANKTTLLAAAEKREVAQQCAAAALRQKLALAAQARQDAARLQEENHQLLKTLDTLKGLKRVLHDAECEAEHALGQYGDTRTLATFAIALKRALWDSESSRQEWRARQRRTAAQLAEEHAERKQLEAKLATFEREHEALKKEKRKSDEGDARAAKQPRTAPAPAPSPAPAAAPEPAASSGNTSITSQNMLDYGNLVDRIVQADSPYLNLQRSGLAMCALKYRAPPARLKPSELAALGSSATSIFRKKDAPPAAPAPARPGEAYDGLGGRAAPEPAPAAAPRAARPPPRLAPRRSARHRLSAAPRAAGSRDIAAMLTRRPDE